MRSLVGVALLFAQVACAQAPSATPPRSGALPEVNDSGIPYKSPQEAIEALTTKPTARLTKQGGWSIVEDQEAEKQFSLWSFTPADHPAHPSMVKRTMYEENGQWLVRMKVKCGASKEACDKLVREFQALNHAMATDLQRRKQ